MTSSRISRHLPIINIASYLRTSQNPEDIAARQATSEALHSACLQFGFFYLDISEYIDPGIPEELATLAHQFFALPQEEKDKLSISNQDNARGYARLKENVTNGKADNHEGLDFYRPVQDPDPRRPLWGENQWPDLAGFKEKYEAWVQKMKDLGLIVSRRWMAIGLGMTPDEWQELRSQVDDSFWVMRAIGYPPLPDDHDGFSCGAHKDYGCLTFLYADPIPSALQVFLRQTGSIAAADATGLPVERGAEEGVWINADPIPGCVVCNIGEMWEVWTNGLYKSTLHRVIHRSSSYRVSVPFFFEPNFDSVVKPLAAAKRIQGAAGSVVPEKKPVVYGEFLLAKVGGNFAGGKYDD
ncbi:Clavaminate synthase-like protein [Mycena pura]|uniref:Clavaminate synthase-like protein n=1 Tax=Mycena pura TaxID=153505 RepID=A0AAD6VHE4_9AGAR|nr:Clavaminate synthase-like protein [Mycena pura]